VLVRFWNSYETSIAFHFRITFDFDVIKAPIIALHSFDFNCSSKLLIKRCFRVQRSISLKGPSDGCIELFFKQENSVELIQIKSNSTLRRRYLEEHFQ